MSKYNLKIKTAQQITDKAIEEQRNEMGLSNKAQGVVQKNINLSIPTKDKDNTIPLNAQLDAVRKNETSFAIIEKNMDNTEVSFGEKTVGVSSINEYSEKLDAKRQKDYKKAEDKSKQDTVFWDKYVGVQLEGEMKNITENSSNSSSQLQNNPDRFKGNESDKGKKIKKMVMASLQDADAMLFHIYATANSQGRKLNKSEKQQTIDINCGKNRIFAQIVQPVRRSLEYSGDPIFKKERDGSTVVYHNEKAIDKFKSCEEAKANYPEGDEDV